MTSNAANLSTNCPIPTLGEDGPRHRTVVAVDVQGFSDKPNPAQRIIRDVLPACLAVAFHWSGIDWPACAYSDRGDGALIVLPAGADTIPLLNPLPGWLATVIGDHNGRFGAPERFALRMAVNAGTVHDDLSGHTGGTINDTARILDARPLRRALAGTGAPLAVAVSTAVHDDFVRHGYNGIDPATYVRCRVSVKRTRTWAWVHVPFAERRRVRRAIRWGYR